MKLSIQYSLSVLVLLVLLLSNASAQNPLINDQFTADPSARVFGDKVYVYPSHDLDCGTDWFCMKDYHVFSSKNLVDWTDHGVIVSQDEVDWVDPNANAMWAPDAYKRDGTYYFYFPAIGDSSKGYNGRKIGVATAESPEGPYNPQPEPIENVDGIDPNVFVDDDGQAYLYWSGEEIYVAKLKDNMVELASEPKVIENLPDEGLKEGPYMVKRKNKYYLTYPHVEHERERLEYAMADSPMGPFEVKGVIMDQWEDCWTNHHSIIEYEDQWYLFYHHNDYSPNFDKNRSIRADSLSFNADGTIQEVEPTLRGVGITNATKKIQIDRYSKMSDEGVSIAFLDTTDKFKGWKTVFQSPGSWIRYNRVNFGPGELLSVEVKVFSKGGGMLQIRTDNADGKVIGTVEIPKKSTWDIVQVPLSSIPKGVGDLNVNMTEGSQVEIDWIRFK